MARHNSIKLDSPCELINITSISPLIAHCQIKVCYIGLNRNGSYITKEIAQKLANTLPGSPIVGFYNKASNDFEEHNRTIEVAGGKLNFTDNTQAYGFVDLNARAWFQDYLDDNELHTYLVTEGWIWTDIYPEAQRIITKGNNQSMELDPKTLDGVWTKGNKDNTEFFIINRAIISKLCILGEDFEPCFEGASIEKFSLNDDFNYKIYSLMKQVKDLKGGNTFVENENTEQVLETIEEEIVDEADPVVEEVIKEEEPAVEEEVTEEILDADEEDEVVDEVIVDEQEVIENNFSSTENQDKEVQSIVDDFHNLQENYSTLEARFNELQTQFDTMQSEYTTLVEFKKTKDREEKQALIDSFCMLSDEDKSEVQSHIDEYSLDDIEAKLSIICVRNKLDLSEKSQEKQEVTTFSLGDVEEENDNAPAWLTLLRKAKETEN